MTFRRRFLRQLAATALIPAWAGGLRAQPAFPSRALRIVVPNAAGGAADITARTIGQVLSTSLGQPVVIENRPGAGGVVAGELVARAEPDGHTLLLVSSGTAVSAALFKSLPFDTLRDFAPVSQLATFDLVLVAAEGGRFRSLNDLLAWARANPGKLNLGTPQMGTTQHLAAELFKASAGIDAQVVPFNGTPPVITALRSGEVDAGIDILGPLMGQIGARALRPLAVLGAGRPPQLPDVPAAREAGGPLSGFDVSSWNGLAVPAKTPAPVIERLHRDVNAALARPEVRKRLAELNLIAQGGTPAQLGERLAGDIRRWSEVIARARIPKQ
ncbi:MAG TPA: tripartite tricarboxylate transporter substrate binding protein [Ramlibacter sp.]|jgi:tripartite-type tricarboxylate transporter receptor subunit TctC|uniref:Bug family tripartite tricarboxylate transporter substrate binding protein n=1 Tax=Ramlibacter sp. TaxID=1917967 RepID=UPI002D49AC67|nr:tripartite tricarboxylate transporter substrate binding protein [Ramlibacter sp.]HZY17997.1 tripartite tricarboxylate transporter substrate binding protein [Ramlibacter sp.]